MKTDVDFARLPQHIAIIMDGNGRWAKRRFLSRAAGHRAGAQALRKLSEQMNDAGFRGLTVYAFSTENWNRSAEEVDALMGLLREYIQQYIDDAAKNNMRIAAIGDMTRLDADLREKIAYLTECTRDHAGMRINIAINYGGRDELVRAAGRLCADVAAGKQSADAVDEALFASYLDTADVPDPELLIRTSGEMRLSNFLPWQAAYTELVFSEKLWPDFKMNDLLAAVSVYQSRERRFGGR